MPSLKRYVLACLLALAVVAASPPLAAGTGLDMRIVDPMTDIMSADDVAAAAPLPAVRMVGPRNGVCSGVVVVGGAAAASVRATVSDLTGPGTIPAQNVLVRYAGKVEVAHKVSSQNAQSDRVGIGDRYTNFSYYDVLCEEPPAGATLVPIWVTARVPAAATPGIYNGVLTVGGVAVPVRLDVAAWSIPDPRDWVTHAGFVQSPETLAAQYGVPLWSREHWHYQAQSMRMMGELGAKDAFLPVVAKTHLGNDTGMIRFDDGRPDFRIVEAFLQLWKQCVGDPHAVIVYLWEPSFAGRRGRKANVPVTLASGQEGALPMYGSPASEAVWKPVLDGIRTRVNALGWGDEAIIIGACHDQRPPGTVVEFLKRIAPYARWAIWTHGAGDPPPPEQGPVILDGMVIGHYESPYCPSLPTEGFLAAGWLSPWKAGINPRKYIFQYSPLTQYRTLPQGTAVFVDQRYEGRPDLQHLRLRALKHSGQGFTRVGFDCWELNGERPLLNRYLGDWSNMYRYCPWSITHPGPLGPLATARYEMLREGMQETEARTLIEKALVGERITGRLADECKALLAERIQALTKHGKFNPGHGEAGQTLTTRLWGVPDDWQGSALRLFNLAGAVTQAAQ